MTYRNVWAICLFVLLIAGLVTFGPRLLSDEQQHRLSMEPIRQDQTYHHFADDRPLLGVANAGDTLSNLAFIAVGVLGLLFMWRERHGSTHFEAPEEMRTYWVLFGALTLTGLGSAYYHQAPDDARLVWDRLPMAIAFMSLLTAIITERVSRTMGVRLLVPLVALGVGSVVYWAIFEDLWPYYIVQFGSMAVLLVLAALYPSRYTKGGMLFLVLAVYIVAKLLETYDRDIYELGHWASGHSLKHVAAACGGYLIMHSLMRRSVRPSGDRPTRTHRRTERARHCAAQVWNPAVLIFGATAWVALPWSLESFQPSITTDAAWLVFPALIAAAAYWLMKGSPQVRTNWLAALAFVPIAVFLIPAMSNALDAWESLLAMMLWILWLLSYFAAVGLCAAVNAGISSASRQITCK